MKYIPPDIQGWRDEVEDEMKEKRIARDERLEERDGAGGLAAKMSRRREMERNGLVIQSGGNPNIKVADFTS